MNNATHSGTQVPRRGHAFKGRRDGATRTLHRTRGWRNTLVALIATLVVVLPTPTATAAEINDVPMARAADPLTSGEAKQITKYLLRNLLGPAVSSAPELSMIAAWKCRTNGDTRGTCRGAVTGGIVTCRGLFRVVKYPKGYAVFPLRMECATK